MAKVKAVQSGMVSLSGTSTTTTLTAIVLANSYLVFGVRGDLATGANVAAECCVSGEVTNTTTLTFARQSSNGTVEIEWFLIEFMSGVTVQRGTVAAPAVAQNVTLTSVDLTKAYPIVSWESSATGSFLSNSCIAAEITSATNLQLRHEAAGGAVDVHWQVAEYDNATVQKVLDTPLGTTDNTTISATTGSLTFTHGSFERAENGSVQGREIWQYRRNTSTNLTWRRDFNVAVNQDWVVYVVSVTDAISVQRGDADIAALATTVTPAITTVNLAVSSIHFCLSSGYWATFNSSNTIQLQREWVTAKFNSSTEIEIERGEADGTDATKTSFEVVEWEMAAMNDLMPVLKQLI